jgi:hypothetical protein
MEFLSQNKDICRKKDIEECILFNFQSPYAKNQIKTVVVTYATHCAIVV